MFAGKVKSVQKAEPPTNKTKKRQEKSKKKNRPQRKRGRQSSLVRCSIFSHDQTFGFCDIKSEILGHHLSTSNLVVRKMVYLLTRFSLLFDIVCLFTNRLSVCSLSARVMIEYIRLSLCFKVVDEDFIFF